MPGGCVEVLLVEDNPGDVYLTCHALEEGMVPKHVNVVEDGEQALEFLRQRGRYRQAPRPELIILDLNLPRIDGRRLLNLIKADPTLMQIPVVVLSTSNAEPDVVSAYEHHANCYLTKPSELFQYLDLVRQVEAWWMGYVRLPAST